MLEIKTEKVIDTSIENTWKVLSDFNDYQNWNSIIPHVSGKLRVGEKLAVQINSPHEKPVRFTAQLLRVNELQEIRWVGSFFASWLFRGEHYFQLTKISEQKTLFTHGEIFTGLLIPLLAKKLKGNVKSGYEVMNNDLAQRCETLKPIL